MWGREVCVGEGGVEHLDRQEVRVGVEIGGGRGRMGGNLRHKELRQSYITHTKWYDVSRSHASVQTGM